MSLGANAPEKNIGTMKKPLKRDLFASTKQESRDFIGLNSLLQSESPSSPTKNQSKRQSEDVEVMIDNEGSPEEEKYFSFEPTFADKNTTG